MNISFLLICVFDTGCTYCFFSFPGVHVLLRVLKLVFLTFLAAGDAIKAILCPVFSAQWRVWIDGSVNGQAVEPHKCSPLCPVASPLSGQSYCLQCQSHCLGLGVLNQCACCLAVLNAMFVFSPPPTLYFMSYTSEWMIYWANHFREALCCLRKSD